MPSGCHSDNPLSLYHSTRDQIMAATATLGQIYNVVFVGRMFNQTLNNTLGYQITQITGSPTTQTVSDALAADIGVGAGLQAKFLACCPPSYTLVSVNIQVVAPLRLVGNRYVVSAPGTFTADATTANLAAVMTRRGDVANRKNISSFHIPYANEDPDMSNGGVSDNMFTQMLALAPLLKQNRAGGGSTILSTVIINRPKRIPPAPTPPLTIADTTPITIVTGQTTVRVMRRRTVGVGK